MSLTFVEGDLESGEFLCFGRWCMGDGGSSSPFQDRGDGATPPQYLNDLPIIQTMVDYIEADDCISYIAQHKKYADWEKLIVSSDKDFFQLILNNERVFLC